MNIKVFDYTYSGDLEQIVQDWLNENPGIVIRHIAQSEYEQRVTLTIFYTKAEPSDGSMR
jgi:hypothetical protein